MKKGRHKKVFITVKTYPMPSLRYVETVCTAGIDEQGNWIRLYPIPFRRWHKNRKFKKYQWIKAPIVRDTRDPRPESYRLTGEVQPLEFLDTKNEWRKRKKLVIHNVFTRMDRLLKNARNSRIFTSLAIFKPKKIIGFHIIKVDEKSRSIKNIPYRFYYSFIDEKGRRSKLQILDWEIYELCRKIIKKYGSKKNIVLTKLKEKYFDQFLYKRDIYFFFGTHKLWHIRRSKNPFMIVGIFYPPRINN